MIMHVITNFTASAGAETMLARLLRVTAAQRVIVVSLQEISERNRKLADNPRVEYIALGASSSLSLPGAALKLARLIRRKKPDAVLCWMYHAMVVGTLASTFARTGTPIVWNVRQSLDDPKSLSRSSRIAIAAGRLLSGRAAGIVYNSSRALALHHSYGYRNGNSLVIPNGFDLPAAEPIEPRKAVRVGIAARFHPQKDHATFFRAAAAVAKSHPDARFSAAGHGLSWDNPAVVSLIMEAGLARETVDLRGEVSDMDLFYKSVDVLALSSRTEGFPNVLAEAMSHARPVVATDVGDAAVIVGDAGIIVPPRDPRALAAAIRATLDLTPSEYAERARRARSRIENEYGLHAIERKYTDFLNSVGA